MTGRLNGTVVGLAYSSASDSEYKVITMHLVTSFGSVVLDWINPNVYWTNESHHGWSNHNAIPRIHNPVSHCVLSITVENLIRDNLTPINWTFNSSNKVLLEAESKAKYQNLFCKKSCFGEIGLIMFIEKTADLIDFHQVWILHNSFHPKDYRVTQSTLWTSAQTNISSTDRSSTIFAFFVFEWQFAYWKMQKGSWKANRLFLIHDQLPHIYKSLTSFGWN